MSGAHDIGGAPGFGAVEPEPDEPVFHADWEGRVLALHLAMGAAGEWTLDEVRAARESLSPAEFGAMGYYQTVLAAIERLVTGHRLVAADEIAAGRSLHPAKRLARRLAVGDVVGVLSSGSPSQREAPGPARFRAGDPVRAAARRPVGHTRLPRYAWGHVGTVVDVHGCHAFPDARAQGLGDDPQWLYTVRFEARELWGPDSDPALSVSVDAFEPYLEPAP